MISNNIQHVHDLVKQLNTPDNEIRRTAETHLDDYRKQPDFLLSAFVHWATHAEDPIIRSHCAVLLGRYGFHHFHEDKMLWDVLPPANQSALRSALLAALLSEAIPSVRSKIGHAVADIANALAAIQQWPELLQFIVQSAMNPGNVAVREQAFQLLAFLTERLSDDDMTQLLPTFKPLLHMGLTLGTTDPATATPDVACDLRSRVSSLKALVSFLHSIKGIKQLLGTHYELVGPMIQTVTLCLQMRQEELAREALSALLEATEAHPIVFRTFLDPIVSTFIPLTLASEHYQSVATITMTHTLEDMTRTAIIEWLVTLAEKSPVLMKRHNAFIATFIPVLLTLMSEFALEDGDDDPQSADWYTVEDLLEDEDLDSVSIVAEQAIDRLSFALGGRALWPVTSAALAACLSGRAPLSALQLAAPRVFQLKHAALMCLSAMAEGCLKAMLPDLEKIVQEILMPCMRDPHPRVRFACCNAMGQLSTDFAPKMQKRCASAIMPALLHAMRADEHPRVQSHAAAATINFCEHASRTAIEPYLDKLLESLVKLLHSSKKYLQVQAVTSIAVVAMTAKAYMMRYYAELMRLLMAIMQQATAKEYRLLRGKAMECATLIGLSVGKEVFREHAHLLMRMLSEQPHLDPDDPQATYMMTSWSRIARCLGNDFLPYLPAIMPALMAAAAVKPQYDLVGADEATDSQHQKEGYEYVDLGTGEKLGIKTSIVEEKSTAVEMLRRFAVELGAGFQPYAVDVLQLLVPLLNFMLDDTIKSSAAMALAPLLSCLAQAGHPALLDSWLLVHRAFQEVLRTSSSAVEGENKEQEETELEDGSSEGFQAETATLYWAGYRKCLAVMLKSPLRETLLAAPQIPEAIVLCERTLQTLFELFQARQQHPKARETAVAEEEEAVGGDLEAQEEMEMEDDVLSELTDVMHVLLEKTGAHFLSLLNPSFSVLANILNHPRASELQRQWALCAFDDLIEYTGPLSFHYAQAFWPVILRLLQAAARPVNHPSTTVGHLDEECPPFLLQAAVYAVGVAAQHATEEYRASLVNDVYPLLVKIVGATVGPLTEEDYMDAMDNAVAATVKYLRYVSPGQTLQTLPWLLKALPLKSDEDEADVVYGFLCDCVEHSVVQQQRQWMVGHEKALYEMLVAASRPRDKPSSGTGDDETYDPALQAAEEDEEEEEEEEGEESGHRSQGPRRAKESDVVRVKEDALRQRMIQLTQQTALWGVHQ